MEGVVPSISEGQWTTTIYSLINEKRYQEVVSILTRQLEFFPNNRAGLSLLAYCYYYLQDFPSAVQW
jgi:tetratricopeptide repeat protein 30